MIIATAGHVDHGKTTLLQALTGVHGDRLPEEKRRGMTIDLGYAYWPQQDGRILGFIDVPGHEKFLSNMLSGIGGIDHGMLAVACDDGIMAQTIEHLALLRLTGRPNLTVVLTKASRVDASRIEAVKVDVENLLAQQGWQNVAIFVTDAVSDQGISELRTHIQQLAPKEKATQRRFRLAIDRVFTVKGAGVVVTGTALSGHICVGDTLWLTGADKSVRVRGIHAQNQDSETACAGQRVAINITGDIEKSDISRGDWLMSDKPQSASSRLLVALEADLPIKHWQSVHLHHGASHVTGRVSLLDDQQALAELVFDAPLYLAETDRVVIRDISGKQTLGVARVLHLNAPRRGKRQVEFLAWLTALANAHTDEDVFALTLPRGAISLAEFSYARQLNDDALQIILDNHQLVRAADLVISEFLAKKHQQHILDILAEYHKQHDDQLGVGRSRLQRMTLPTMNEMLVFTFIESLMQQGKLKNTRGWLHLPTHGLGFGDAQQLWQKIEPLLTGVAYWVRDIANELGEDEKDVRNTLRKAAQLGYVTAIVNDRYFKTERIHLFANLIKSLHAEKGCATAADFRDALGLGRKLAIQILEFFDKTGFTRRRGNDHLMRDANLFGDN